MSATGEATYVVATWTQSPGYHYTLYRNGTAIYYIDSLEPPILLGAPAINDAGCVAVVEQEAGTDERLYCFHKGTATPRVILRSGDELPGRPGFGVVSINAGSAAPIMNGTGQLLFKCLIWDGLGYEGWHWDDVWVLADTEGRDLLVLPGAVPVDLNNMGQIMALECGFVVDDEVWGQWTWVPNIPVMTPVLHWRGGGGAWGEVGNWTLGLEPAFVHDVLIDSGAVAGPVAGAGENSPTVRSLVIGGDSAPAQLVLEGTSALAVLESVTIADKGTLSLRGGTLVCASLDVAEGGLLDVDSGFLVAEQLSAERGAFILTGGQMAFDEFSGDLVNAGGIIGGSTECTTLVIHGDFTQTDGTLILRLAGTDPNAEFDRLVVEGSAVVGGSLEVAFMGGFFPSATDVFDLFGGALAGEFAKVILPNLPAGLSWDTSGLYANGSIAVTPEPATLGFLAAGGLGLLARRRRKRGA